MTSALEVRFLTTSATWETISDIYTQKKRGILALLMNWRTVSPLVAPHGRPLLLTPHTISVLDQVTTVGTQVLTG